MIFFVNQAATLGYVLSMHPPSIDNIDGVTHCLNVVRRALAQLKENDD